MSNFGTSDFDLRVRQGDVTGHEAIDINGYAEGMGTTEQSVWGHASILSRALIDTASTVKAASTSANDDSAGTGAQTITLTGLDASGAVQTETVTMDGTTEVTSANTYSAINTVEVATVGSGQTNDGNIWIGNGTFTSGVPGTKYAFIEAGDGISKFGAYVVPAGKELYLQDVITMVNNTSKSVDLRVRKYDGTIESIITHVLLGQNSLVAPILAAPAIAAGSMIYLTGSVDSTTADVSVMAKAVLVDV